jgi:hypothetical protein
MKRRYLEKGRAFVAYTSSIVFLLSTTFAPYAWAVDDKVRAQELAVKLQSSMTAIEDSDREAARDRWDPAYIVETVGPDPEKLFAWVRGHVQWVPYHGVLRGPVGVLMDRHGNSIDQALLVAALFKSAGKRVRLAHSKLSAADATALWKRLSAVKIPLPPEHARGPLPEQQALKAGDLLANSEDTKNTTEAYGLDHEEVARTLKSSISRGNSLATDLHTQAQEQTARLLKMVTVANGTEARKTLDSTMLDALADHWWVQVLTDSSWVDADPLADRPKLGSTVVPAVSTMELEEIPADLKHTVTVRIVVEQWKEGKLAELVPLEAELDPREVLGTPIQLMHSPTHWPSNWPEVTTDTVQIKLRAAVFTQT